MSDSDKEEIQADEVGDLSPHNKALYEAGKSLLVESISVGREFCKFMTTTALSAIPLYLALLKFVLPKEYTLQSHDETVFLVPPIAFFVSSGFFILGYFPQSGRLSLDLPSEIERERAKTIRWRRWFSFIAFIIFAFGVCFGVWQVVEILRTGSPSCIARTGST